MNNLLKSRNKYLNTLHLFQNVLLQQIVHNTLVYLNHKRGRRFLSFLSLFWLIELHRRNGVILLVDC